MPKKVRKLRVNRVDLVPKGANQEAHVLLFKRDDELEDEIDKAAMTLQEMLDHDEAMHGACEDKWKLIQAFERSMKSIMDEDDESERVRLAMTSAAQFVRLMGPVMDTLNELEEDVSMAGKSQEKAQPVDKADETVDETLSISQSQLQDMIDLHVEVKDLKGKLDSTQALLEAMTKRAEAAESEVAKRNESNEGDIWKTATPAQRKAMEAERLEKIELQKQVEEGKRYQRQQECITKASGFEFLPINPDDDWEVFFEIDKMEEKHANRIYQLLKAGDINVRRSGLGKERGFNGSGEGPGDSAYEQIEWLASEEIAKTGVSYDEAIGKVARAHPALYRQYTLEIQTRAFDKGD